jgi:hypothetical protein
MAKSSRQGLQHTEFINVDIDVKSQQDPEPLIRGLGSKVFADQLWKTGRTHWVRFMHGCSNLEIEVIARLGAQVRITVYSPGRETETIQGASTRPRGK